MFRQTKIKLSNSDIKIRFFQFLLLTSPLVASYFFSYSTYKSPFSCPILAFTGIPCPSCGLTRSFLSLTRGNVWESFSYHLFGPVIYSSLIVFSLHLLLEIFYKKKIRNKYSTVINDIKIKYLILVSFIIYYVFRLLYLQINGDLINNFQHSPLGEILYR
ncbi:DUF2752 domain-containing protein [Cyanobacterium sp. Dongsha4]|uniref:DUF2752 domain-containing protein n=1 Tax=Cyanobacterium sp. DS4 TaxID=2878255 RepID=UPI002E81256D|nr:DUF2752 domain-containing protein [Cyanobacterium sp. Dongsha4]WVK99505.1 DUF2752 domain-containing protein [Cyanobacterium sp. Dongsha4]